MTEFDNGHRSAVVIAKPVIEIDGESGMMAISAETVTIDAAALVHFAHAGLMRVLSGAVAALSQSISDAEREEGNSVASVLMDDDDWGLVNRELVEKWGSGFERATLEAMSADMRRILVDLVTGGDGAFADGEDDEDSEALEAEMEPAPKAAAKATAKSAPAKARKGEAPAGKGAAKPARRRSRAGGLA